ncbi:hypothetical protein [Companilactobacillus halodurans]|uniref:Uncharacterized protein n=1 Tax=Companilactobacillus halodurans TaxID=2584183 RepID=A0A5P0ZZ17_9LACO|nr:hypothetical protein [Companilactobacillus halodurans]MQS75752.1 hypothetical protein [Companilactobacillus halodurans]MQS98062.1 hypothetical protein [Companilactobacillus halodurans]
MKKKILIGILLSCVSTGTYFAVRAVKHSMKENAAKKDREKLESFVEKYLHGNDKLMDFVRTLSDDQVKELISILESLQKQKDQLKIKAPILPKYLEKKVTNLIN